jgi:hypothetical protein
MITVFRKIVRQGGVIGLWRGCWPNVQRAALVNLGDLSTYDRQTRCMGFFPVLRIRIPGSMRLTNGSGSFYFHHLPSRCQQKTNLKKSFLHIIRYLLKVLKHQFAKVKSHKTVEIKVFRTIFA